MSKMLCVLKDSVGKSHLKKNYSIIYPFADIIKAIFLSIKTKIRVTLQLNFEYVPTKIMPPSCKSIYN